MCYVCVSQDDYRRGVNEYDEKVFVSFKLILRELRNIYVSILVLSLKQIGFLGDIIDYHFHNDVKNIYTFAKLLTLCSNMTCTASLHMKVVQN